MPTNLKYRKQQPDFRKVNEHGMVLVAISLLMAIVTVAIIFSVFIPGVRQ